MKGTRNKNRFNYAGWRPLLIVSCGLLLGAAVSVSAQMVPKADSPLYGGRPERGPVATGLPKMLQNVGIDQKLNQQIPLDLTFKNESGEPVTLKQYFGKRPVIISLVYYNCPMLCTQVLNGMIGSFKTLSFLPGQDYEVVTVSFDSRETPALASAKKDLYVSYLPQAKRAPAANGWHFLTGDEANITKLAQAVGFRYQWDEATNQFAHASGIMVATPEGKLSQYYYGIEYSARDLRLGLVEASSNKIGTPVDQLLLYCYHYDPATGTYGARIMNMVRLAGALTVVGIVVLLLVLRRRGNAAMPVSAGGVV
ncbi:MAG TPA: SCO family protein [Pyrinomonadaceae bacterium]|nr:SCO family protein [Pyrinomonadaceae bacterium]